MKAKPIKVLIFSLLIFANFFTGLLFAKLMLRNKAKFTRGFCEIPRKISCENAEIECEIASNTLPRLIGRLFSCCLRKYLGVTPQRQVFESVCI